MAARNSDHQQVLTPGLYRAKVSVEKGAGFTGQSPFYYVIVVPAPSSFALVALTFATLALTGSVRGRGYPRR